MKNGISLRHWLPLVGLTCAAFIFNTSEFIPIGLLSDIAADFRTTEAHAGMLISVYAWIVTALSLPLMLLVSKIELRRLLLCTLLLFAAFQALSALASGYAMLMLARAGVACTHAVFWSIVSPLAVRIVPDRHRQLALSMIVTGTSVAMIFGLPLGRMIGLQVGWRMTFACVGGFALLTLAYLFAVLPEVPSRGRFSLHKLPDLLRNPLLTGFYLLTFIYATAYYTSYSYIEPFLKQIAGLAENRITEMLMLFGAAGILGSAAFAKYYLANPVRFIGATIGGLAACLLLLLPSTRFTPSTVLLCACWGMAVTAFNVALQDEIINHSAPDATAVSMSIFSGIFNLGIGCGTLLGGTVCTYASISEVGLAGGLLAFGAWIYWRGGLAKRFAGESRRTDD